ncbi:MAG: hypothetical protein R3B65_01250 [Candidatus Paceibacterota bacterium]
MKTKKLLGENDELQEDPNFHLGETIDIPLGGNGLIIEAGDHKDLILRLVNFQQPQFDNTVPYNEYIHKYLMFGFLNTGAFDFKWDSIQNSPSFTGVVENNTWGKKVRIPQTSLSI